MNIPQNIISRLNELPIEEVADRLGIEVRRHKALCFKHDDHNPSITFSTSKNIYKCWVCGVQPTSYFIACSYLFRWM
ncbi:MAG: hypothetical protein E7081_07460 [Bacteroidales bacterium]|nr:hypothetical protein [Bacteroidales bacterium]